MAGQDAVEETRRLLSVGNEQILRVTPENFDTNATDAWPAFRRGVVRAEGCREVPTEELLGAVEGKAQVLAFLADFAERKKGYRRQVETVLRILLKGPEWLQAARSDPALSAKLPGAEVAEMLSVAVADEAAAVPAAHARAEAASLAAVMAPEKPYQGKATAPESTAGSDSAKAVLEVLQSSFKALNLTGDDVDLDRAVLDMGRFSDSVTELLRRKVDADIEEIARLEPKVPVLQVLCVLHEKRRSARSRVNDLLFTLMETPSLASWRATAEQHADLRGDLEGLGILDHAYGNDVGSASGDEKSSVAETRSSASGNERLVIWMWRDAGNYGGWFSHKLATLNPARWSTPCSLEEAIADLEAYLDTPQGERPVKVRVFGAGIEPTTNKSATVAGAVAALRLLLARR